MSWCRAGPETPRSRLLETSLAGVRFLQRHARDPSGHFYFCVSKDGAPVLMQRKMYSACFYIMGLAVS